MQGRDCVDSVHEVHNVDEAKQSDSTHQAPPCVVGGVCRDNGRRNNADEELESGPDGDRQSVQVLEPTQDGCRYASREYDDYQCLVQTRSSNACIPKGKDDGARLSKAAATQHGTV